MSYFKEVIIKDADTGVTAAVEDNDGQGCLAVCIQDQVTETIDSFFNQSVSNFTLSADTTASTETSLNYVFSATPGHGIVAGNEILLLDVVGDVALQGIVIAIDTPAVDDITIDKPIDNIFPSATSLGRIVISNMNVVGSLASPQIFTFRAGADAVDVTRVLLTMLGGSSTMDDGKFGNITALTNGIVFRIYNGLHKTIFNFKTNSEIKQFCYDVQYSENAPAGDSGLTARITFGGQDKHGVVLRVSGTDVIQWIVQDDLSGMTSIKAAVEGHKKTTLG